MKPLLSNFEIDNKELDKNELLAKSADESTENNTVDKLRIMKRDFYKSPVTSVTKVYAETTDDR